MYVGLVASRLAGAWLAAVTSLALVAPPAAGSGTPIGGVNWQLNADSRFENKLLGGCMLLLSYGWRGDQVFYFNGDPATGTWDLKSGVGALISPHDDPLQFDTLKQTNAGRPFRIGQVGLELSHGKLYLTGTLKPSKRLAVRALRRQRLAVIAHPRLLSGPALDNHKRPVPGSFLYAVQGTATVTTVLSRAIERVRCSGRNANPRIPHVRAGNKLGLLTAQLLPTAADAAVSAVTMRVSEFDETKDYGAPVAVTTGDGATMDADRLVHFTPAPGTHVPVICELGLNCKVGPGATISPPGTFTFSDNGRSAVLGGLVISYSASSEGVPVPKLAGALNGVQLAVTDWSAGPSPSPTDEFLSRLSDALGTGVFGFFSIPQVALGSIGPVP